MRSHFLVGLASAVFLACGGTEFQSASSSAVGSGGSTGPGGSGGAEASGGSDAAGGSHGVGGSGNTSGGPVQTGGAGGGATDSGLSDVSVTDARVADAPTGTDGPTGGPINSGDCSKGTDCKSGRCVDLTPGGFRVCAEHYPEATMCDPSNPTGGCCTSVDCKMGALCYAAPAVPICSGVVMIGGNVCAADQCTNVAGCPVNSVCIPAGAMGRKVAACLPASCRHDADCSAQPKGNCAPVVGGCCNLPIGLACVYPTVGCRKNDDCPGGACAIDMNGASYCLLRPPICPR